MIDINKMAIDLALQGKMAQHGVVFKVEEIAGASVLRIEVETQEELPIFVSVTEEQILCIAYLFKQGEIKSEKIAEMNDTMLSANISMPLSSFAKIGEQYVIYGALSTQANLSEIMQEIEALSSNSIDAIKAMKDYLI
jgi:uncharacterized protein